MNYFEMSITLSRRLLYTHTYTYHIRPRCHRLNVNTKWKLSGIECTAILQTASFPMKFFHDWNVHLNIFEIWNSKLHILFYFTLFQSNNLQLFQFSLLAVIRKWMWRSLNAVRLMNQVYCIVWRSVFPSVQVSYTTSSNCSCMNSDEFGINYD